MEWQSNSPADRYITDAPWVSTAYYSECHESKCAVRASYAFRSLPSPSCNFRSGVHASRDFRCADAELYRSCFSDPDADQRSDESERAKRCAEHGSIE
jgi:hypothetical protein